MLVTKTSKAIVLVIDNESYSRMGRGDPFTLSLQSVGVPLELELVIGSINDKDIEACKEPVDILRHIFRGYEKRPEDNHEPYKVEFSKDKHE